MSSATGFRSRRICASWWRSSRSTFEPAPMDSQALADSSWKAIRSAAAFSSSATAPVPSSRSSFATARVSGCARSVYRADALPSGKTRRHRPKNSRNGRPSAAGNQWWHPCTALPSPATCGCHRSHVAPRSHRAPGIARWPLVHDDACSPAKRLSTPVRPRHRGRSSGERSRRRHRYAVHRSSRTESNLRLSPWVCEMRSKGSRFGAAIVSSP